MGAPFSRLRLSSTGRLTAAIVAAMRAGPMRCLARGTVDTHRLGRCERIVGATLGGSSFECRRFDWASVQCSLQWLRE